MVILISVLACRREEIVDDRRHVLIGVEELRDRLAAVRQARIRRRGHTELAKVFRRLRQVVGDDEVREPAPGVADFDRHARQDFMLDRRADVPVRRPDAPAAQQRGIVRRVEHRLAERQIADLRAHVTAAAAQILRERIRQITVGFEVVVRIGPRARRRRLQS